MCWPWRWCRWSVSFRRSEYPADWPEIRARILRRAGGSEADPRVGAKCEWCGAPNYAIRRGDEIDTVGFASYRDASGWKQPGEVVVVLTIAHIDDPDPANCADENLAALCQRCHLRHDVDHHRRNAARTRRRKVVLAGQMEMTL